MLLGTASKGGTWHPLTSLIQVGSPSSEDSDLYLVPVWEPSERVSYSDALHELTHQWCARNTRLGMLLGRHGGDLWSSWLESSQPPVLSPGLATVLGTLKPLMEGLALYAQLDYLAEDDGDPVYSPLAKAAELFSLALNPTLSTSRALRAIREERLAAGLLRNLFLEASTSTTQHYFIGYLYVKALELLIARRSTVVRGSKWFLPFAIKLLLDDPAIVACAASAAPTAAGLIRALHDSVCGLGAVAWRRVDSLLGRPDVAEWFDAWDLRAQAASDAADPLGHPHTEILALIEGQGDAATRFTDRLRAHTTIHVVEWRTGRLGARSDLRWPLLTETGEVAVLFAPGSNVWGGGWDQVCRESPPERAERLRRAGEKAVAMEHGLVRILDSLQGDRVTIGLFLAVHNLSLGAAVWKEGELLWWTPFFPEPLCEPERAETMSDFEFISLALQAEPSERRAFAQALSHHPLVSEACAEATHALGALLVGSESARWDLDQRFLGPAFQPVYEEIRSWCQPSPFRVAPVSPPPTLRTSSFGFDLPGFPPDLQPVALAGLLPIIVPPYDAEA